MTTTSSLAVHMEPVMSAVRAGSRTPQEESRSNSVSLAPFVTISRESGAGGWSLGRMLADRLNELTPTGPAWRAFDRELVERVAADSHISEELIASLGEKHHSWIEDLFAGLSDTGKAEGATEFTAFRRVAQTIRALSKTGRVIIVGRGGAYITRGMPGGIHLRIVAPIDFRVAEMSRKFKLAHSAAVARVRELDHNREQFVKRYFPSRPRSEDVYSMILNSAKLGEQAMVECVAAAVRDKVAK